MKKIILMVLIILAITGTCFAGVVMEEQIAVDSGTTKITTVPDSCKSAIVQVSKGDPCRMTLGKVPVSSSFGMYLDTYNGIELKSYQEIVAARFTIASGSGASIYVIGFDYR